MSYDSVETGSLLITHPGLGEPSFHETVILVLDHSEQGTHGLILNRPDNKPLVQGLKNPPEGWHPTEPFYAGGPVFKNNVFMLHSPDWTIESTTWVTDDLCLTMGHEALDTLRDYHEPHFWRMFLGSAAWGPGQLEMEFSRGSHVPQYGWLIADYPGADWIFEQDPDVLYTSALSLSTHQAVSGWL